MGPDLVLIFQSMVNDWVNGTGYLFAKYFSIKMTGERTDDRSLILDMGNKDSIRERVREVSNPGKSLTQ